VRGKGGGGGGGGGGGRWYITWYNVEVYKVIIDVSLSTRMMLITKNIAMLNPKSKKHKHPCKLQVEDLSPNRQNPTN